MDQPKNEHDENNAGQDLSESNVGQDAAVGQDVNSTPYQDETAPESMNDPMEGMQAPDSTSVEMPASMPEPSATEVLPEQQEQAVIEAEEHVAEAHPQAASDELADVASELQAMEGQNFDAESSAGAIPESSGTDPMQQIEQDEAAANPEPVAFNPPEVEEVAATEASAEAEAVPETVSVSSEPTIGVEPSPLEVEPSNSDGEHTNSEAGQDTAVSNTPENQSGQMINDVIAPTSTAVAAAEGTMGTNAITGTPETTSTDAAIAAGSAPKPEKPKPKKGLLILIVILVTLLFGGAAVAAYLTSTGKEDNKTSQSTSADQTSQLTDDEAELLPTAAPGEEVEAATLDDYKVACGSGKVLNAADYAGTAVHPIVMFEMGSDGKYAQNIIAFKDKTWAPESSKVTTGQLVGCISMKTGSETKLKSCPITDPTTKVTVNVDYYSASYIVDVYEAKTGDKIASFDSASIATECPTTAVYDKTDPKIYAKYDLTTLETSLKEFVTKTL